MRAARSAIDRTADAAHTETERGAAVLAALSGNETSESSAAVERLRAFAADACVELFGQYDLPLARVRGVIDDERERVLSGHVDFAGDGVCATCSLVANRDLLEQTGPGCEPRDWIGELANQVVGRLKITLLTFGVEVRLATPLTTWGAPPLSFRRGAQRVALFSCGSASAELWLKLVTSSEFRFDTFRPIAVACGEVLLF